mmetsp:Transcript_72982/g.158395  ORF Transcript_72982/g.158395 Transcript_72982/m.158395 type:complete len:388 (+) Transcript_72982:146-1309(+)
MHEAGRAAPDQAGAQAGQPPQRHGGAAHAARLPGLPARSFRAQLLDRLAHRCGAFVHIILVLFGLAFVLHVIQVGMFFGVKSSFEEDEVGAWRDFAVSVIIVLHQVLLLFFQAEWVQSIWSAIGLRDVFHSTVSLEVWAIWIPGLLGFFLAFTGWLGLASRRRQQAKFAVPYAACAAVLLVWQANIAHVVIELASWEDPSRWSRSPAEVQRMQKNLFKVSRDALGQLFVDQQCQVGRLEDEASFVTGLMAECRGDGLEAQLLPVILKEFCGPRMLEPQTRFARRVRRCSEEGLKLGLLPQEQLGSDAMFCQCWPAVFNLLDTAWRWVVLFWAWLMVGVLSVLYTAAEKKTSMMSGRELYELGIFAFFAVIVLTTKVMAYPEAFPWDS